MVVDRLTKPALFPINKRNDRVKRLIRIYLKEIVRLHGVPIYLSSLIETVGPPLDFGNRYKNPWE